MSDPTARSRRPQAAAGVVARSFWPLALVLLLLLSTACGRVQASQATESDDYAIDLVSRPETPQVGPGLLVIAVTDAAGDAVRDAQVQLEANMNHAGMVPVLVTAAEELPGQYHAPITWTMAGDWWVDVVVELGDGRQISRRFPIAVSAGGS